jgi:hypothetical protein
VLHLIPTTIYLDRFRDVVLALSSRLRHLCWSLSHAPLATSSVYPVLTRRRYKSSAFPRDRDEIVYGSLRQQSTRVRMSLSTSSLKRGALQKLQHRSSCNISVVVARPDEYSFIGGFVQRIGPWGVATLFSVRGSACCLRLGFARALLLGASVLKSMKRGRRSRRCSVVR